MLADEITADLRAMRAAGARERATAARPRRHREPGQQGHRATARSPRTPTARVDTSRVDGVDPDLRVRPFFAHGGDDLDPRVRRRRAAERDGPAGGRSRARRGAAAGGRVVTPAGMVLDGSLDTHRGAAAPRDPSADPGRRRRRRTRSPTSLVDYLEFYLLNYFKPATGEPTQRHAGRTQLFEPHRLHELPRPEPDDRARPPRGRRRDGRSIPQRGIFNRLFATATPLLQALTTTAAAFRRSSSRSAQPLRGAQHLHRLQAPRSRPELPRAQLRRHDADASS